MDEVRKEVAKWTPREVERVTGVPGEQLARVAEKFATQKPSTFIWCMGGTQHTVGTANVRAYCNLLLATGNVGSEGMGANIFRGHCNVQGATDLGLDVTNLPLYYGLAEGAWRHWARVWEVPTTTQARFDEVPAKGGRAARTRKQNMETAGIPSTRWFDATTMPADDVDQRDNVKAMIVFGHGGNTVPRMPASEGHERARPAGRRRPASDDLRASSRSARQHLPAADLHPVRMRRLAHRVEPLDAVGREGRRADLRIKNDYWVIYKLAEKLGFADRDVQEHRDQGGQVRAGADGRNRSCARSTAAAGRPAIAASRPSAEGAHAQPGQVRSRDAARAQGQPEVGGDYYGLPWPCWGTPEIRHPGTHILYNTNLHVKDGGGTFRARFGLERDGETLLAEG
jgi:formate dehydrogenase major subunit